MILEAGQGQPLREYSALGWCRPQSRCDAGLRNATRVASAVSKESCPVGASKTQVPRDCPREKRSSDLSKDIKISKVLVASEVTISFERDDDILCFVYRIWFYARAHLGREFEYVNSIIGEKKKKQRKNTMSVSV